MLTTNFDGPKDGHLLLWRDGRIVKSLLKMPMAENEFYAYFDSPGALSGNRLLFSLGTENKKEWYLYTEGKVKRVSDLSGIKALPLKAQVCLLRL